MTDDLVKQCINSKIDGECTITDYVSIDASDAVALGILKKAKWHWMSDIQGDEFDEALTELVKRFTKPFADRIEAQAALIAELVEALDHTLAIASRNEAGAFIGKAHMVLAKAKAVQP